ncbi:MAG TPA: VOC family protein [Ktedonobacteraceae bacterium]|nr:VOC family protein [Ktedonobacteraceae bacterium]
MTAMLKKLTPNLMVEDVNRTVAFYQEVLGFELLTSVPEEGQLAWAMLKRGGVELMFQTRGSLTEELPSLGGKDIGGTFNLYIDVEDIQGLYAAIRDKVTVVANMHTTFYGANEIAIEDCNGYILTFAESANG